MGAAGSVRKRPSEAGEGRPILAAFVVSWDPASYRSLVANASRLTHVMPEWIRAGPAGELRVEEDARVFAAARHLEIVPTVSNFGAGGFQRDLALPLFSTVAARAETARRLRTLCEERGYAGLNLDLEALLPEDQPAFAALVEAVFAELHPRGYLLSIDVPADPAGMHAERLAAASDFLVVMAYDLHASADRPGPISTPPWVSKRVLGWTSRVPAAKVVVALGAYGYDWRLDDRGEPAGPAQDVSFDRALALARENEVPVEWDAAAQAPTFEYDDDQRHEKHRVWFQDAPGALAQLTALGDLGLRGTAIWRLGAEDPQLFELFAPAPLQRRLSIEAARAALARPLPHDPADVEATGAGELFSLRQTPQAGRREVELDAGGVANVRYAALPSGHVFERRGPRGGGKLALTFDDGPDPTWTPKILDVLKARGVRATFFVLGENAQAHPELIERAVAEGHLIGNHTFTHPELKNVSALRERLELTATARLLEWIAGIRPVLFRPPFHADDAFDEPRAAEAIALAASFGYRTLGHDIDPEDYAQRDPAEIARRVLAKAHSGSVILLHDAGGDRSATVAALPLIIDGLAASGVQLVPADELFGLPRAALLSSAGEAESQKAAQASDALVFGGASALRTAGHFAFWIALVLLGLRILALAVLAPLQARRKRSVQSKDLLARFEPTVSVVVPAYNEEAVIERTVRTLLAQEPPVLEILCIDDGSTDATLEILEREFGHDRRVRILGKENGGKASALNLGFLQAHGELVVALDGDTLFARDTVAHLCAPFVDPRVAAVAGNAKVGNVNSALTRWQALEYITAQNLERRAWDLIAAVPIVPGAVGAWRRDVVLRAGGFHEDTLAEDTDLTLRLLAQGHRVSYAERGLAFTEAPETARGLLKQRFRWTYGVLQACWKHRRRLCRPGSGALGWLILPTFVVYQVAVPLVAPLLDVLLALSLVRGQLGGTAVAYASFLLLDGGLSALAISLEGEDLRLLRVLPVQRFAHRFLLWAALVRSLWTALSGLAVGWGKLHRTGSVLLP